MDVKNLMTPVVSCVRPDSTIVQAAKQMRRENIGSLPVCNDKGELLGIITDRDIVLRAVAETSEKILVGDVMTTTMITATPAMNTHDAALLMSKYQIRRLPVVSGGKLTGILALADIARKTVFVDEAGDVLSAVSKQNSLT